MPGPVPAHAASLVLLVVALGWLAWGGGPDRAGLARDAIATALVATALAANLVSIRLLVRSLAATRSDLHSSEARFRDGIENMRDGFALWDRDDRLIVCNEMCRRIYAPIAPLLVPGADYADVTGRLIRHLLAGRPDEEIAAITANAIAAHRRAEGERVQERPDGTAMAISEVPTGDGGIMSIYRDVSAERRAMRALAASEAQFRDAIHSISEGFVLWSKDEHLVIWNQRVIDLLPHLDGVLEVGLTLEAFYDAAIEHARPDWPVERRA
jgi:PAS domain-containing protein